MVGGDDGNEIHRVAIYILSALVDTFLANDMGVTRAEARINAGRLQY